MVCHQAARRRPVIGFRPLPRTPIRSDRNGEEEAMIGRWLLRIGLALMILIALLGAGGALWFYRVSHQPFPQI